MIAQRSVAAKSERNENNVAKVGVEVVLQKMLLKPVQQKTLLKCCCRRHC
jgi:hypothetical protein